MYVGIPYSTVFVPAVGLVVSIIFRDCMGIALTTLVYANAPPSDYFCIFSHSPVKPFWPCQSDLFWCDRAVIIIIRNRRSIRINAVKFLMSRRWRKRRRTTNRKEEINNKRRCYKAILMVQQKMCPLYRACFRFSSLICSCLNFDWGWFTGWFSVSVFAWVIGQRCFVLLASWMLFVCRFISALYRTVRCQNLHIFISWMPMRGECSDGCCNAIQHVGLHVF